MTSYSLTVLLDQQWLKQFRTGKMNLCTSFSMTSNYSKVTYNVVATHEDPTPLNTITWTDDYRIAASKSGSEYGAHIVPSTFPTEIQFGQSVNLLRDWTLEIPDPDPLAPTNGFLFKNATTACALVFKTIRNRVSPMYVTSVGSTPPPPGRHTLTPGGRVMVFFADAESPTAFDERATNTNRHEYSYVDHPHVTIYFDVDGRWQTIDDTSSDAVATDAFAAMIKLRSRDGPSSSPPGEAGKAKL